MLSVIILPFAAVALAIVAGPASAQTLEEQSALCSNSTAGYSSDQQIAGCTAVIGSGQVTGNDLASVYFNRAIAYVRAEDYTLAIADYSEAIRVNPQFSSAYNNRCWYRAVYLGTQLNRARQDCDAAIKLDPTANHFRSRGMVGLKQKRLPEAWKDYDTAAKLDPASASSLYGRGMAALRVGRTAAGRADIARAESLDPTIVETYVGYGIKP